MNVGFISLGCSKNLIDTEVAIGIFKKNNYKVVNDETQADIIVVNTCGFIESAKEEAINTILEMAEHKKKRCKYLIVMGCLVQRYYEDLLKALPEVDLFIRIDEYENLWNKIEDLIKNNNVEKSKINTSKIKQIPLLEQEEFMDRIVTTGENFAYLKIGEGCSNMCTYCAIPYIRGTFISRKMEDIVEEAKMIAKSGITELILIAQDTTKYGIDLYGENKLEELITQISKIKELRWIRFLYSYPEGITDELIQIVKNNDKVAKYFDIPIQHISNNILKRMNRKTSKENIIKLITKIRKEIPNVTLRTSLIVGFPGETKEDFEELMDFVKFAKFDKLGAFQYSKEDGTPAASFPNQVHGNTKKARFNKIMKLQNEISENSQKAKLNKTYEVLIESFSFDKKFYIGRTMQDVPDIDGLVYLKNKDDGKSFNKYKMCKIIDVSDYDLIGEIL